MSATSDDDECDDSAFTFNTGWGYTAFSVVIICGLYVFGDAYLHPAKRKIPGKLLLLRTLIDVAWALLFFYMIIVYWCYCSTVASDSGASGSDTCQALGCLFALLLLWSLMQFSGICWDMYFTLVNPFRKLVSDSWQMHGVGLAVSLALALTVYADEGYKYRKDYQICWTKNTQKQTTPNNHIVLYLPLSAVIIGGLGIIFWAVRRLQQRILMEVCVYVCVQTVHIACFSDVRAAVERDQASDK